MTKPKDSFERARWFAQRGRVWSAARWARRAAAEQPGDVDRESFWLFCAIHIGQLDPSEGLAQLLNLEADPEVDLGWVIRVAIARAQSGDFEGARDSLVALTDRESSAGPANASLAALYGQRDRELSSKYLRSALNDETWNAGPSIWWTGWGLACRSRDEPLKHRAEKHIGRWRCRFAGTILSYAYLLVGALVVSLIGAANGSTFAVVFGAVVCAAYATSTWVVYSGMGGAWPLWNTFFVPQVFLLLGLNPYLGEPIGRLGETGSTILGVTLLAANAVLGAWIFMRIRHREPG